MNKLFKIAVAAVTVTAFSSCLKDQEFNPETEAMFLNGTSTLQYYVRSTPGSNFKIPVGVTNVSDVDRTVTITTSSPTGATEGTHYSIASKSITIPAGKAVDSITLSGIYNAYPVSRVDTLLLTLQTNDNLTAAGFNSVQKVVLRRYCDVLLADIAGVSSAQDYDDTGAPDGGGYSLSIAAGTSTGTTGTVVLTGLWGIPRPVTVNLNWTNPSNFTATIPDQNFYIHGTYGQVKIRSVATGSFSSCANTMTLIYEPYVPGLGTFGTYTTEIEF